MAVDAGGVILFFLACRLVDDPDDGLCPTWSGLDGVGRGWAYERFSVNEQEILEISAIAGGEVTVTGNYWVDTYACDEEGAWLVSRHEDNDGDVARTTYDPPALVMPRHLAVGDAWTAEWTSRRVDDEGADELRSVSTQFEVLREAETWVPAGSWSTIEIGLRRDDGTTDLQYWARDVGLVLAEDVQLWKFAE